MHVVLLQKAPKSLTDQTLFETHMQNLSRASGNLLSVQPCDITEQVTFPTHSGTKQTFPLQMEKWKHSNVEVLAMCSSRPGFSPQQLWIKPDMGGTLALGRQKQEDCWRGLPSQHSQVGELRVQWQTLPQYIRWRVTEADAWCPLWPPHAHTSTPSCTHSWTCIHIEITHTKNKKGYFSPGSM